MTTKKIIVLIIALVIILVPIIYLFLKGNKLLPTRQVTDASTEINIDQSTLKDWVLYTNSKNTFSFLHPSDWKINQDLPLAVHLNSADTTLSVFNNLQIPANDCFSPTSQENITINSRSFQKTSFGFTGVTSQCKNIPLDKLLLGHTNHNGTNYDIALYYSDNYTPYANNTLNQILGSFQFTP